MTLLNSKKSEIIVLSGVIFSLLFLRAFKIGPFSISSYISVILMIFSFYKYMRIKREKGFYIYICYLAVLVFSSLFNGDFLYDKFWQNILVYHLPGIAFFLFSSIYINNQSKIKKCVNILIVCYLFNAIVSFGQFFKVDLAWHIGQTINSNLLTHTNERQDLYDSYVGHSLIGGITGFSVTNGYYIATFSSVFLAFVVSELGINKKLGLGVSSFMIISLFYVIQQRMAFILCTVVIIYYLFTYNRRIILPSLLCTFFLLVFYDLSFVSSENLGRLNMSSDNNDRYVLLDMFFGFLDSSESFWGGINHHKQSFQHNTFLSAWYDGGFFSFVIYVILYGYVTLSALKKINKENIMLSAFAISTLMFNLYSQTHSNGVQNGAIYFWIPYSLMIVSHSVMINENIDLKNN